MASRRVRSEDILGWLGWTLGCLDRPEPCRAEALLPGFNWATVPEGPVQVPEGWETLG